MLVLLKAFFQRTENSLAWHARSLREFTNVQCWPQDPYFPFSSLVPHFSEVWKCGKVWQTQDNVTLFPQALTPCHSWLSSTLLRGLEVHVTLFPQALTHCHYFARLLHTSTPLRSVELSKKWRNSGFHGQGWTWPPNLVTFFLCIYLINLLNSSS